VYSEWFTTSAMRNWPRPGRPTSPHASFPENGSQDPLEGEFYIGSADWMRRNLSERFEAVTPGEAAPLRARLWEILDVILRDHRQAWDMRPALRSISHSLSELVSAPVLRSRDPERSLEAGRLIRQAVGQSNA
jgi:hypothetical protein